MQHHDQHPPIIGVQQLRVSFRTALLFLIATVALGCGTPPSGPSGDEVAGNLILINDNGAWCWYQDERVIVDTAQGQIVLGSVAHGRGVGDSTRNGDVEISAFDLGTGQRQRATLKHAFLSYDAADDHNAPALWMRPDGRYFTVYAGHNNDFLSRYRATTEPHRITSWQPEETFNWNERIPGGSDMEVSYSNLLYLSAEDRLYNFARTDNRSPNIMISDDRGASWTLGGKLTYTEESVGYVNGYFKYASNGTDRIHFVATEHHPRDFNNSIYHGYIEGGQSFMSDGTLVDDDIFDQDAPSPNAFTPVFAANTVVAGDTMTHAWTIDLHLDANGRPYTVFQTRANEETSDHRFFYARHDGDAWQVHPLCKAGPGLHENEQDYLGLVALDPNRLNTVYASTPIDPRTDDSLGTHEIFRGVTPDRGASWNWTPITQHSESKNLRPVVPTWDTSHVAVFWYRGEYDWQHDYDAAIVGLIDRPGEQREPVVYVDASIENTRLADGDSLSFTGPADTPGTTNDGWHERTRVGNEGSVLAAGTRGSEDAPPLQTTVAPDQAGTYDVWAYFWARPDEDWRLQAGLDAESLLTFRQIASQQVDPRHVDGSIVYQAADSTYLYQAYVGRAMVDDGTPIRVFIDDRPSATDGSHRTWYDGVGYARLQSSASSDAARQARAQAP
jgi:hypothetical protein